MRFLRDTGRLFASYVNEIIVDWLDNEAESGARHCMEDFLTWVVVDELRKSAAL
jgi:hypothetical protein